MVWLYSQIGNKTLVYKKTPLDTPLLSFFVIATISWIFMLFVNIRQPYLIYGIYSEGFKRWLFLLTNSILVYYSAVYFVNNENRSRFIHVTFLVGFIASVYGLLQYFGIEIIWPHVLNPFGGRSVSTFGNPNFLSSYLVLLFPLVFLHYFQSTSFSQKFFYFILLMSYFATLLCTLTRSSWLGLFTAMLVTIIFLWIYEKPLIIERKRLIIFPLILFASIIFFWPKSKVAGYSPSVIERLT